MSDRPAKPQRGDEHELFQQWNEELRRRTAKAVPSSPDNVDDACAYAWMQLITHQPDREFAIAWLTVVARRRAIDLKRDDNRLRALVEPDGKPYEIVDERDLVRAREAVLDTRAELEALSPQSRRAVVMKGLGFTSREVGEALGITKSRLSKIDIQARDKLKQARADDMDEEPPPRVRLLDQLCRDPPLWARSSIGRCPSLNKHGGEVRLQWCRLAMRIVDHRAERGISDPLHPLGADPTRDAETRTLLDDVADFKHGRVQRRWQERSR